MPGVFYTSSTFKKKRCLVHGQMAHQSEERFREALSQDLGTISSNVLGISRAGGNSIWASLTGMSSGLSRCRNIEGGRAGGSGAFICRVFTFKRKKISLLGKERVLCSMKGL